MIPEVNLKSIKIGDTYVLPLEFYSDECEETPINVSGYTFKLMAKNSAGVTEFTWNNADFVSIATNKRTVTLSSVTTTAYNAGDFQYELQVTTPDGVFTWMQGYINVSTQITS